MTGLDAKYPNRATDPTQKTAYNKARKKVNKDFKNNLIATTVGAGAGALLGPIADKLPGGDSLTAQVARGMISESSNNWLNSPSSPSKPKAAVSSKDSERYVNSHGRLTK